MFKLTWGFILSVLILIAASICVFICSTDNQLFYSWFSVDISYLYVINIHLKLAVELNSDTSFLIIDKDSADQIRTLITYLSTLMGGITTGTAIDLLLRRFLEFEGRHEFVPSEWVDWACYSEKTKDFCSVAKNVSNIDELVVQKLKKASIVILVAALVRLLQVLLPRLKYLVIRIIYHCISLAVVGITIFGSVSLFEAYGALKAGSEYDFVKSTLPEYIAPYCNSKVEIRNKHYTLMYISGFIVAAGVLFIIIEDVIQYFRDNKLGDSRELLLPRFGSPPDENIETADTAAYFDEKKSAPIYLKNSSFDSATKASKPSPFRSNGGYLGKKGGAAFIKK